MVLITQAGGEAVENIIHIALTSCANYPAIDAVESSLTAVLLVSLCCSVEGAFLGGLLV